MRLFYLDVLRVIATFLVLYSHLVIVGTYAVEIPGTILQSNNAYLPLIPANTQGLHKFGDMLYLVGTEPAVIGVVLFFTLTGYLSMHGRWKSDGKEYLKKRARRLYPTAILSTIIAVAVLHLQGIQFTILQYIGSFTLMYPIIQVAPILVVGWFLVVELIYYLILSLFAERLSFKSIVIFDGFILFLSYIWLLGGSDNLLQIVYFLKYIPIIFI